jgi:hypothetical protein
MDDLEGILFKKQTIFSGMKRWKTLNLPSIFPLFIFFLFWLQLWVSADHLRGGCGTIHHALLLSRRMPDLILDLVQFHH